jgi:hypothetical protein
MKVRCISTYPNEEQLRRLGPHFNRRQTFGVSVGTEYLVLGIAVILESSSYGTGFYVNIQEDNGHFVHVPLCLCEITDGRLSKHWRAKVWEDGEVTLWPPSFYREYYVDDLSEGVSDVVADFRRVRRLLEAEAAQQETSPSLTA